jgi:hypothetical protein
MSDDHSVWVHAWWVALSAFSVLNVALWAWAARSAPHGMRRRQSICCAIVVAGCAFRSFLPRADVQRICLVDSWLSCVAMGRSVATVAELCIVAQWALYLYEVGLAARVRFTVSVAKLLVPVIAIAEVFSWYAVLTTNYVGNVVEQSIWTLTAALCLAGLLASSWRAAGTLKRVAIGGSAGCAAYVAFMVSVDIPMYLRRLEADTIAGRRYLSVAEGAYDAAHRWVVTHRLGDWREEMAWMFFYFTGAVWLNIVLIRAPSFEVGGAAPGASRGTGTAARGAPARPRMS